MPFAAPVTIAVRTRRVWHRYTGRMAGVAFVAHCLLNQNAKVDGGARCAGVYSPLVGVLRERGWRIEQMPCPELTFTGLNRFWAVREQLDTAAFRRHCRRQARAVAGAVAAHVARGDEVVLIGLEGSPSMGVRITSSDPGRGGRPEWPEGTEELSPGQGIFLDELRAELRERGIATPRATGIMHQLPDHDPAIEQAEVARFLAG
jgi:predicted secreted protein